MFLGYRSLTLIIDANLSKHQYCLLRSRTNEINQNICPSYNNILNAKSKCYPNQDAIIIKENSAEISLQELLDHTIIRLIESFRDDLKTLAIIPNCLKLISKWGCDGSSGLSRYKQKFTIESNIDDSIFISSFVPLQLYADSSDLPTKKIVFWSNPRPSSTRYCRPIKFQFVKETEEVITNEYEYIEKQIKILQPTKVHINPTEILNVKHEMVMTMVDGKVCNALTKTTSTQTCYICGATPKQMNEMSSIPKDIDPLAIKFGLSPLHAWIRCFECLLHISYRLELKKWRLRKEDRNAYEKSKKRIQGLFRKEMGLLVDLPLPGGKGSSNDGNTARRFFEDVDKSSQITGLDKDLIYRFSIILKVISSGFEINVEAFNDYCLGTYNRFVENYSWYYMPVTVHKILIHGAFVISNALLPIGQLSEEAQEARNKDFKRYREIHTRKLSRIKTNEDLLHLLLISSDPLISSMRKVPNKPKKKLGNDVIAFFKYSETPEKKLEYAYLSDDEDDDDE